MTTPETTWRFSASCILLSGCTLFFSSFMPAILGDGRSPFAAMIGVVGLVAIGTGIALQTTRVENLTESRLRGLYLALESLILAAFCGAYWSGELAARAHAPVALARFLAGALIVTGGGGVVARIALARQGLPAFQSRSEGLFTIGGRIGRLQFWLFTLVLFVANVAAGFFIFAQARDGGHGGFMLALTLYLAWLPLSVRAWLARNVKRLHDRGMSGWWTLLSFIPIFGGVWEFVALGCWRGARGSNAWGDDPKQTRIGQDARITA